MNPLSQETRVCAEKLYMRSGYWSHRDLIRGLINMLAAGGGGQQQICLMALGHCHPDHHPALLEELPLAFEDAAKVSRYFSIYFISLHMYGCQPDHHPALLEELPLAFEDAAKVT